MSRDLASSPLLRRIHDKWESAKAKEINRTNERIKKTLFNELQKHEIVYETRNKSNRASTLNDAVACV